MTDIKISEDLYRVLHYCHAWGVRVDIDDYDTLPPKGLRRSWSSAPASMGGILWSRREKRILWSVMEDDRSNELLHELSHCLDRRSPWKADEVHGPMLAFEYYSNRYLKIGGRSEWMVNFGLGDDYDGIEWTSASTRLRGNLIRKSFARAVRSGLLTEQGRPTFVRR